MPAFEYSQSDARSSLGYPTTLPAVRDPTDCGALDGRKFDVCSQLHPLSFYY